MPSMCFNLFIHPQNSLGSPYLSTTPFSYFLYFFSSNPYVFIFHCVCMSDIIIISGDKGDPASPIKQSIKQCIWFAKILVQGGRSVGLAHHNCLSLLNLCFPVYESQICKTLCRPSTTHIFRGPAVQKQQLMRLFTTCYHKDQETDLEKQVCPAR